MGCFVGCFGGISNKKKRRKPPQRFLLRDIIHGSYEPLDSSVQPPSPTSIISSNNVTAKIKKKVRFDLNVRTYEPVVQDESDSDESCSNNEDTAAEETPLIVVDLSPSDRDPAFPPLPLNNRYQNCRGSCYYEEEDDDDEYVLADSDFEYESDEDVDSFDDGEEDSLLMPLAQKTNSSSNEDGRPRGRFAESVLNPVENLTQWKAVKAKEARPPKSRFKENIAVDNKTTATTDLEVNKCSTTIIKVNTSLSNWLPDNCTAADDPYLLINNAHTVSC